MASVLLPVVVRNIACYLLKFILKDVFHPECIQCYGVPGTGTVVDIIANNKKKEERRRRRKAGFFLLYLGSNSTVLIFMILDVYGNLSPYEIAPAFCTNFSFLHFLTISSF